MPLAVLVPPVSVAESVTEPPAMILDKESLVVMLGLSGVTVRVIVVHCVNRPLVTVTFKVKIPAASPALMLKPVELFPPDVSLRLARFGLAVGPNGETRMLSVTVPAKPFKLLNWTDALELL